MERAGGGQGLTARSEDDHAAARLSITIGATDFKRTQTKGCEAIFARHDQ